MSIVKNEHLLLCTLLLAKSMALEFIIRQGKVESCHFMKLIIAGALDLTQKTAKDGMTPISETFSLDINSKLDITKTPHSQSRSRCHCECHSRSHDSNEVTKDVMKEFGGSKVVNLMHHSDLCYPLIILFLYIEKMDGII
ncbi:uncharacterized protein [Glycine max]|uniref:uncharacterized protein n=1 Tax=Glycine max TaxID=3847 RepID=UPI001B355FDD|nr:uncharacterized protein LOC106796384 [Glycine max]